MSKCVFSVTCALSVLLAWGMAGCSEERAAAPPIYNMGDRVQAGPLVYAVVEATWHDRIGEGATARMPQNRFLVLRLTVTNSGAESETVPTTQLEDGSGRSYAEVTDGQGVTDWLGVIRRVGPAQTEDGRLLFDVPRAPYQLRVTHDSPDPDTAQYALIQIPPRFETQETALIGE
jgi:hypothetical protein